MIFKAAVRPGYQPWHSKVCSSAAPAAADNLIVGVRDYGRGSVRNTALTDDGLTPDQEEAAETIGALLSAGQDARKRGDRPAAKAAFTAAEVSCGKLGLTHGSVIAQVLHGQAAVLLETGDAAGALELAGRAVARLGLPGGPVDDLHVRVSLLATTGLCLRTLGEYERADKAYRLAIEVGEAEPGESLAIAMGNYGAFWSALGDPVQARAFYADAIRVLDEHAPESAQRPWLLANLGGALQDAKEHIAAISALEQSLEGHRSGGDRRGELQALLALSDAHDRQGDPVAARSTAASARNLVESIGPRSELHARCLRSLGHYALVGGDPAEAVELLSESLEIASGIAARSRDAIDTACMLAATEMASGAFDEAVATAAAADSGAEWLRRQAPAGTTRQALAAVTARAADMHAAALMLQAKDDASAQTLVDVLERRQARRLTDQLGIRLDEVPAEGREEIAELRAARRQPGHVLFQAHMAEAAGAAAPLTPDEISRARARARHVLHMLDAEIDARLPEPPATSALTCAEIRDRLASGQCVVHCLAAGFGGGVATITEESLRIRAVHDDPASIERGVDAIVAATVATGQPDVAVLQGFSEMLLTDVPSDAGEVIVVADGPLHRLPWAMLPDPHTGEPLGICRRLTHAASVTAWVMARDRPTASAAEDLLILGDPSYTAEQIPDSARRRLSGTATEVRAIRALVKDAVTVLTEAGATESALRRELPRHRRAHLACHGHVDADDARFNGLLLAPAADDDHDHDDLLQAWEIADLDLPTETVVLSACSAAAGDVLPSEGLIGLVHAFQLAGARQVLAPLWPIDDAFMPDFLAALYYHLNDGHSLDEATRRTRKDFRASHPKHWAGWSVYGPPAA